MKLAPILFLLLIACLQVTLAKTINMPVELRTILGNAAAPPEVRSIAQLPKVIVSLCADEKGRMANPGQKWQATDVVDEDGLPWKRLIWAAIIDEHYVVHYERGGNGHSLRHFVIAHLKNASTKANVVWHGVGDEMKDYQTFLKALNADRLDDSISYDIWH
ncbi:MAG: hypothetical protein ABL974_07350 [Prosthecobacter sp.]